MIKVLDCRILVREFSHAITFIFRLIHLGKGMHSLILPAMD